MVVKITKERQRSLFRDTRTIQERFEEFDGDYPDIDVEFRRRSYQAKAAGFTRYSAKAIFEGIRWHWTVEMGRPWVKVNDHFTSRYVRKFIRDDPSMADFFELRELRSE